MSEYLQKIIYLTKPQYDTLKSGGTIGSQTGLHSNYLYCTTDENITTDDLGDLIVPVSKGGTGKTSFTVGSLLVGNSNNALTEIAATTSNIANTVVKRDANGAFSMGLLTAGELDGGQHIFNGNIQVNAQSGSYNEGIRINRSTTGYANIYLGGSRSSTSGSQTGGWWIGTLSTPANATSTGSAITNTVFTISQNNTDDGFSIKGTRGATRVTDSGWAIRPRLAVGTTYQTGYTFYANGTSYLGGAVTATDNIIISKAASTNDLYVRVGNTSKSKQVELLIGGSSGNAGIYDRTKSKWIVYSDTDGNVTLNGNANTATTASKLTTSNLGSATKPIYLVAGVATECTELKDLAYINKPSSNGTTTYLRGDGSWVSLSDMGLSNALHFIGTTSTQLTDGATTSTLIAASTNSLSKTTGFVAGDVVIYSDYEFVWLGSAWEKLGDDSSFKVKQTAITDSTGTSESTTATRFVYSVSQNEQGVISVKTRPLPTYNNYSLPLAASGTRGGVQIGYSANGKNYPVQLSSEKMYVNVPWTDTNTKVDQTLDSSSTDIFPLLFSDNNATVMTATVNTSAKRNNLVYVQPSQSLVAATKYLIGEHVTLQYNSTDSSLDFVFI